MPIIHKPLLELPAGTREADIWELDQLVSAHGVARVVRYAHAVTDMLDGLGNPQEHAPPAVTAPTRPSRRKPADAPTCGAISKSGKRCRNSTLPCRWHSQISPVDAPQTPASPILPELPIQPAESAPETEPPPDDAPAKRCRKCDAVGPALRTERLPATNGGDAEIVLRCQQCGWYKSLA